MSKELTWEAVPAPDRVRARRAINCYGAAKRSSRGFRSAAASSAPRANLRRPRLGLAHHGAPTADRAEDSRPGTCAPGQHLQIDIALGIGYTTVSLFVNIIAKGGTHFGFFVSRHCDAIDRTRASSRSAQGAPKDTVTPAASLFPDTPVRRPDQGNWAPSPHRSGNRRSPELAQGKKFASSSATLPSCWEGSR